MKIFSAHVIFFARTQIKTMFEAWGRGNGDLGDYLSCSNIPVAR